MDSFEIIYPSPALSPYVKYYWILKTGGTQPVKERIIPTGCLSLVFHRGERMFSSSGNCFQPRFFICGQSLNYSDLDANGHVNMIVVVFQPWGAKAFLTMPMDEFFNHDISFDEINNKELNELSDKIIDIPDNRNCIELIEYHLTKQLYLLKEYNFKRINAAIKAINTTPQIGVGSLSDIACLSDKQFNRIFSEYVGAKPKEYMRIIRFQRALYTLQTKPGINLTELALDSGYYDQSHCIKEFKALSGYTPKEYLNTCAPYSDYFSIP